MSIRPCEWIRDRDEWWECGHCGRKVSKKAAATSPYAVCPVASAIPREKAMPQVVEAPGSSKAGPGTELKKLLSRVGIQATQGCSCNHRAAVMDQWGPDVCEDRLEECVSWLSEEATKRRHPFVDAVGRLIIKRAISNARKKAASCQKITDSQSTARSGSGDTAF